MKNDSFKSLRRGHLWATQPPICPAGGSARGLRGARLQEQHDDEQRRSGRSLGRHSLARELWLDLRSGLPHHHHSQCGGEPQNSAARPALLLPSPHRPSPATAVPSWLTGARLLSITASSPPAFCCQASTTPPAKKNYPTSTCSIEMPGAPYREGALRTSSSTSVKVSMPPAAPSLRPEQQLWVAMALRDPLAPAFSALPAAVPGSCWLRLRLHASLRAPRRTRRTSGGEPDLHRSPTVVRPRACTPCAPAWYADAPDREPLRRAPHRGQWSGTAGQEE